MNTRWFATAALILGLGVLLPACAPTRFSPAPPPPDPCTPANGCLVQVSVSCIGSAACTASVDHKNIALLGQPPRWIVVTPGFSFTGDDGIAFVTPEGQRRFKCHLIHGKTEIQCNRQGPPDGNTYEYVINLTGPKPVKLYDPWVVNN